MSTELAPPPEWRGVRSFLESELKYIHWLLDNGYIDEAVNKIKQLANHKQLNALLPTTQVGRRS